MSNVLHHTSHATCSMSHVTLSTSHVSKHLRWVCPTPVEVEPCKVATAVAANHTVRVQHGHYQPHELSPQLQRCSIAGVCQEIDQPMYKPTGIALRRMHAPANDNIWTLLPGGMRRGVRLLMKIGIGYRQNFNNIAWRAGVEGGGAALAPSTQRQQQQHLPASCTLCASS